MVFRNEGYEDIVTALKDGNDDTARQLYEKLSKSDKMLCDFFAKTHNNSKLCNLINNMKSEHCAKEKSVRVESIK